MLRKILSVALVLIALAMYFMSGETVNWFLVVCAVVSLVLLMADGDLAMGGVICIAFTTIIYLLIHLETDYSKGGLYFLSALWGVMLANVGILLFAGGNSRR